MKKRGLIAFLTSILLLSVLLSPFQTQNVSSFAAAEDDCQKAIIHYRRRDADYDGWGLHVWGSTPLDGFVTWSSPLSPSSKDDFGIYWQIDLNPSAGDINYIIHRGDEKDPGPDQVLTFSEIGCEIWQVQGKPDQFADPMTAIEALEIKIEPAPPMNENQVILHYRRLENDYDGWGLHIWGPTAVEGITWTTPLLPAGQDEYGIYWIIDMQPDSKFLNYIVHKGDQKDPGPDQILNFNEYGREVWLIEGDGRQFQNPQTAKSGLTAAAFGDIKNKAQAHWLSREYIGWPVNFSRDSTYTLHYDPVGRMEITPNGLQGGSEIPLTFKANVLPDELTERFPHLWNARLLEIPMEFLELVPEILKGQFAIRAVDQDGNVLGITSLQVPGVLDDLYANDESLGITWDDEVPTLRIWAPTAKSIRLHLFDQPSPTKDEKSNQALQIHQMNWDAEKGIWWIKGETEWKNKYYLYEVQVFVRQEGEVVKNFVTDPYSYSLSTNSLRSQIVDLKDPALFPAGWEELIKPQLDAFTNIILYELHLRDFSIRDTGVPEEQRGTYLAFTHAESDGMQHLKWLADRGVSHIHLLPVFDIATINEEKNEWQEISWENLHSLPPDSEEQQKIIAEIRVQDAYNWGYDPFHYTTPEGSYSVFPDGYFRILEFRKMVKALNQIGLRVVMDVVYNHTHASGQSDKSVLDKVVPGYYHRLDDDGRVSTSTCCQNTATEHAMMRKLMIDSVITWARDYKIDGFRFDLMGHHMKADMQRLREALNNLTLEQDGVDGKMIYIYGEGWDFGEVAENARGINATQENMAGTGIGTFNDRIRDAVRGGSPFSGQQEQGFSTSLFTDPNESTNLDSESQLINLLKLKDHIRISLAGNLAAYEIENYNGELLRGEDIKYNGQKAGYTKSPGENITYVSAHDNETLFDAIQYKAPISTNLEERVRIQFLALSLVNFSQGIPFFHAGSEILRSKSMDRDSYDSTDWFNAIDWSYQDNNWGHGLPPKDKNSDQWQIMRDLLGRPDLAPSQKEILRSKNLFGSMLQIRASSPLFRLKTAEQIIELVHFHNTGPDQDPGLIVMSIQDDMNDPIDPDNEIIFVLFNADPNRVQFQLTEWEVDGLRLHPILQDDPYLSSANFNTNNQSFNIPGRSTVVFIGQSRPVVIAMDVEQIKSDSNRSNQAGEQTKGTGADEASASNDESQKEKEPTAMSPGVLNQIMNENWEWFLGGAIILGLGFAGFAYKRYSTDKGNNS